MLRLVFSLALLATSQQCVALEVDTANMSKIPGGFVNLPHDIAIPPGARPKPGFQTKKQPRSVRVKTFWMDRTPVTNIDFREFVRSSKFVTEAEEWGWSYVFQHFISAETMKTLPLELEDASWWLPMNRSFWRQPAGANSSIRYKLTSPVVHMSWNDASAYCNWKNKRLPSDSEWERAVRGGLHDRKYPWGDDIPLMADPSSWKMNIWQGEFPMFNQATDGYVGVSPVKAFFEQNDYGLFDMLGNVWEWTSDNFGPPSDGVMVMRGGSYLDSVDGDFNEKVSNTARMGNMKHAGADNLGFRCAANVFDPEWERYDSAEGPYWLNTVSGEIRMIEPADADNDDML